MKIIPRYVLQHFFPVFGLCILAFTGLYLIIDFFEKIEDIVKSSLPASDTIRYFLYKTPLIITQGFPMSTLLAALMTLGILKRNRELVALRAAGIGSMLYVGPIVAASLALCIAHFAFDETIARSLNKEAQELWQQSRKKGSPAWRHENVWFKGQEAIYQIRVYDQNNLTMEKVSLFFIDPEFRMTRRLDAKSLWWNGRKWVAREGILLTFTEDTTRQEWFEEKTLDLTETPLDFSSIERLPEQLNWVDLFRYTRKIRQEGYNSAPYEVELHLRLALPVTSVILALLGISIGLRQGIHGGIAAGLVIALIVAFLYLSVLQVGCSLGTAAVLPPIVGVWASSVIFLALVGYLSLTDSQ
ncbi:MAG: LPS export ABC transporter permease LptG [Deltaproteobacteria bacterium]|jgi:lipopolysaccharide export system permease protein|nr:LPS export ABC transporter permease LptG [Deltaproteobacteria bacterium]